MEGRLKTLGNANVCTITDRISSENWTRGSENWTEYRSYRIYRTYFLLLFAAAVALAGCFGFAIFLAEHSFARVFDPVPIAATALHEDLQHFLQLVANILHASI